METVGCRQFLSSVFNDELRWSITFGNHPSVPPVIKESLLPMITIDTKRKGILQQPKTDVGVLIMNRDKSKSTGYPDNKIYEGKMGIEYRGSASKTYTQKSYGISTLDSSGKEKNISMFGMPAESDWILNNNFPDRSLIRNTLTGELWKEMGHYAPRNAYCELTLDGIYRGIYCFTEKVKRDSNRVDVGKISKADTSGINITEGYIFKIDKMSGDAGDERWFSRFPPLRSVRGQQIGFVYHYPKVTKMNEKQKLYIQSYVDSSHWWIILF